MITCKDISKCTFYFYELNDFDKINETQWFDKFTNVIIREKIITLPLFITHLIIGGDFLIDNIPSSVTHLYFNGRFNKLLHRIIIPSSVTNISIQYFNSILWRGFQIPMTIKTLTITASYIESEKRLILNWFFSNNKEWISQNKIIFSDPVQINN